MKSKLTIFLLLLFALSFDGMALAKVPDCCKAFNHDGVNHVVQKRKRRSPRKAAKKSKPKVYRIEVGPDEGGAAPAAEPPVQAAPPPPPAPMEMPGGRSSAPKKSAPRIKPPTVQIKPPTE